MDRLDRMAVGHIEDRLLDPERIEDILGALLDRRQEGAERRGQHIAELNQRAAEADMRLKRLYDAIEPGSLDPAEAARITAMLASSAHQGLTGAAVRELADEARSRMRLGTGGYRRDHLLALAQRVEVGDDVIRIMDRRTSCYGRWSVRREGSRREPAFAILYEMAGRARPG